MTSDPRVWVRPDGTLVFRDPDHLYADGVTWLDANEPPPEDATPLLPVVDPADGDPRVSILADELTSLPPMGLTAAAIADNVRRRAREIVALMDAATQDEDDRTGCGLCSAYGRLRCWLHADDGGDDELRTLVCDLTRSPSVDDIASVIQQAFDDDYESWMHGGGSGSREDIARSAAENVVDLWPDDQSSCENCDGRKCMDCVTRTMHDRCENDCPTCCGPAVSGVEGATDSQNGTVLAGLRWEVKHIGSSWFVNGHCADVHNAVRIDVDVDRHFRADGRNEPDIGAVAEAVRARLADTPDGQDEPHDDADAELFAYTAKLLKTMEAGPTNALRYASRDEQDRRFHMLLGRGQLRRLRELAEQGARLADTPDDHDGCVPAPAFDALDKRFNEAQGDVESVQAVLLRAGYRDQDSETLEARVARALASERHAGAQDADAPDVVSGAEARKLPSDSLLVKVGDDGRPKARYSVVYPSPTLSEDGRFLVLYRAPVPAPPPLAVGDTVTDADVLDRAPVGTVVRGRLGDTPGGLLAERTQHGWSYVGSGSDWPSSHVAYGGARVIDLPAGAS